MILQLSPQIPVFVTDRGLGTAIGWIDYSMEHSILWVVALDATGEVWTVPNEKIRLKWNYSAGRIKE